MAPAPTAAASATTTPEASAAKVALPVPEEDFSGWVGSYQFEEASPGFAWVYVTKVEKMPEGYRAHFSLEGNQVSMHFLCKLRPAGPNKVDLLYLREDKENLSAPRGPEEHLFSLERVAEGKVEYRWASIQPNIQPRKEGPAEIGDANGYVKKYPIDFLEVKAVKARLEKLLGAGEYKRLDEYISTQDVIKKNGDILELEGFFPHSGGSQKAMVLYDMKADKLHVLLSDEDKGKTLDVYSEKWVGLPKGVEEKIKGGSLPGLKVVKHK